MSDRLTRLGEEIASFSPKSQESVDFSLGVPTGEKPKSPYGRLDAFYKLMKKVNREVFDLGVVQKAYKEYFGEELTEDSPNILPQLEKQLQGGKILLEDLLLTIDRAASRAYYAEKSSKS